MTSYSHALTMPWSYSAESDDRFQRILRINLVLCLLFGLAMPFLPLPEITAPVMEEPPRLATLILELKPVPPPPETKTGPATVSGKSHPAGTDTRTREGGRAKENCGTSKAGTEA